MEEVIELRIAYPISLDRSMSGWRGLVCSGGREPTELINKIYYKA